jgi:hypothetical protein
MTRGVKALQILGGPEGCLDTIGNVDFLENFIKMSLYRMRTDEQSPGDFLIGGPNSN